VRLIAFIHRQFYIPADIAIVKVDIPFVLQQTLQIVTLAPTGYPLLGMKMFSIFKNQS
jgi:hypothetical protein